MTAYVNKKSQGLFVDKALGNSNLNLRIKNFEQEIKNTQNKILELQKKESILSIVQDNAQMIKELATQVTRGVNAINHTQQEILTRFGEIKNLTMFLAAEERELMNYKGDIDSVIKEVEAMRSELGIKQMSLEIKRDHLESRKTYLMESKDINKNFEKENRVIKKRDSHIARYSPNLFHVTNAPQRV